MSQCKATTQDGSRCQNTASQGSEYCYIESHQSLAPSDDLTKKQRAFCEAYMQCWNGAEAARRAGYKGNESTITSIAHENLTKPDIKEYIDKRMDSISMSTNEVLKRLTDWGRGTLEHFITNDNYSETLSVNTESAQSHLGLIKKIKKDERVLKSEGNKDETVISRTFEIEIHDPKDAVDKLARIRGMYNDKVQIAGQLEIKGVRFD